MADTHETIADIIAWLRRPREGENAYLTLWRDEIADRLEAAYKRERGKNFHRFATADEAAAAWHHHEAKDTGDHFCEGCPFNLGEDCARGGVCSIGWLYAEAQEGGAE